MMNAMHAVNTQNMSFRKVSITFGVPCNNLENKVKGKSPKKEN